MKTIHHIALIALLSTARASGQFVINGSFETGTDPNPGAGHTIELSAGDATDIPGWTVVSGTLDYAGIRWQAGDGSRSLDMAAHNAGAIAQTISGFTVGMQYRLTFLMAANPEPGPYPSTRVLSASIDSASQNFSFDVDGHTATSMGWTGKTLNFSASASTMTLTFTSLTDGLAGPTLDAVAIAPVPEPAATTLFGLAALASFINAWRRKAALH